MTGGGTARCYQTTEAAGVAEGYVDAMADLVDSWVSQGSTTADYVFGQYASKGSTGLRKYVYSTSNLKYGRGLGEHTSQRVRYSGDYQRMVDECAHGPDDE
ncbi:hypothetical protein EDB85DRAFT_1896116 [Lactarius pseudohatsudake]|nr:hypothetical protein EDB85DRAFT_1896116 [Lactarius pseudohatsudake]